MTAADLPRVYVQTDPRIAGKVEVIETDGRQFSSSLRFAAELLPGLLTSIHEHLLGDPPATERREAVLAAMHDLRWSEWVELRDGFPSIAGRLRGERGAEADRVLAVLMRLGSVDQPVADTDHEVRVEAQRRYGYPESSPRARHEIDAFIAGAAWRDRTPAP